MTGPTIVGITVLILWNLWHSKVDYDRGKFETSALATGVAFGGALAIGIGLLQNWIGG